MRFVILTCLIRLLPESEIKIIPAVFPHTPVGRLSFAEVAGPVSPRNPFEVPAKVLIIPVTILIIRTR